MGSGPFRGIGAGIVSAWGVGGGTLLLVLLTLVLHGRAAHCPGHQFALLSSHRRRGIGFPRPGPAGLDRPTLRAAVPAAAAAALAGAWIATGIDVSALRRPFGMYLLLSGISLLLPRKAKKP